MIRRLRDAVGGGARRRAADAAVGRGMTGVLAALDNVIDDDAALARIYAAVGTNPPGVHPGRSAATAAVEECALTDLPGPAVTPARASPPPASRRRLVLRSTAAATAALAAGLVALAAVVLPGAPDPAVSTAYVVTRVGSALNAVGAVAHVTVTTRGATIPGGTPSGTTAEEWFYADQWRAVTYSPAGQLRYDEGVSAAGVYTLASYPARAWARKREPGRPAKLTPGPRGCEPVVAAFPLLPSGLPAIDFSARSLPATVAAALHAAIACGSLDAAGRQRVDGINAIKLASSPGSRVSETIWVSLRTYLPVRVITRSAPGTPGRWQTADISWLKPTVQNLARLTVPVPAGFRRVPFAQAVTPFMRHIPS